MDRSKVETGRGQAEGEGEMTTCPRCKGPLQDTPIGAYCETCRWYFADDPNDVDPGPALPMWIEPCPYPGGGIRTPYGWATPGFDRDRRR